MRSSRELTGGGTEDDKSQNDDRDQPQTSRESRGSKESAGSKVGGFRTTGVEAGLPCSRTPGRKSGQCARSTPTARTKQGRARARRRDAGERRRSDRATRRATRSDCNSRNRPQTSFGAAHAATGGMSGLWRRAGRDRRSDVWRYASNVGMSQLRTSLDRAAKGALGRAGRADESGLGPPPTSGHGALARSSQRDTFAGCA